MDPAPTSRIRHEGCRTCGEDLARLPERPCKRCGWRYHPECLDGGGCLNPACRDPLFAPGNTLPAPRPEARLPVASARKASCTRRGAAFLVDVGVTAAGTVGGVMAAQGLGFATGDLHLMMAATAFAGVFVNNVVFTGLWGASVGKRAVGIKVTNSQGEAPGLGRALLREWPGKAVSQALYFLGYALAAVDPANRALHDHIAGTWVIEAEPSR